MPPETSDLKTDFQQWGNIDCDREIFPLLNYDISLPITFQKIDT